MKTATLTCWVLALAADGASAQFCGLSFVEGFTNFSNEGGWVWSGTFQAGIGSGGVPGFYLRSEPLTMSTPELHSTQDSVFTGGFPGLGVTSVGVDLQSFVADASACVQPLTLTLDHDGGTPGVPGDDRFVYFVSSQSVPCADGTWHSFTIDVPSQEVTLPPGWMPDPASPLGPDATWNLVLSGVSSVRWSFGDPQTTYAPAMWRLGADNLRIAFNDGPSSYCTAKVNSQLCAAAIEWVGSPSASAGGPFFITAAQMINRQNGILFYGLAPQGVPFQGGVLCVASPVKRTPVQSSGGNPPPDDCSGAYLFDFNAWIQGGQDPALVPGVTVYAQYWSRDPAAASFTSLSNAVRFTICP